jgi:predicted nucleic acid-binding protein
VFVDTSIWFAAIVSKDRGNRSATRILSSTTEHVTTDHVLVETHLLLTVRGRPDAAETFWSAIRGGAARLEIVSEADMEAAWQIGRVFPDQGFSLVDRTSFAVMERLGITRAASFDYHFSVYRYGRNRQKAFDILG